MTFEEIRSHALEVERLKHNAITDEDWQHFNTKWIELGKLIEEYGRIAYNRQVKLEHIFKLNENTRFPNLQIEWVELTLKTVAARISEDRGISISPDQLGLAILEQNNYTENIQVIWYIIDKGLKIYDEFKDYYFSDTIGSIELFEDDGIFPEGVKSSLREKQIKVKGEIWELHKNDADPFPSNPHAHNYETGLKLDLSNGNLYKKKNIDSSINKKKLLNIREKFTNEGFTMPNLSI
ncbi:hypothetical protein [Flavobacterium sp. HJSW_4]|uniref:hypothetical protein n=1 Tax=Flavobacterium sp. HJSW_4 TaxID=3344660 RepID=UPI0035F4EC79